MFESFLWIVQCKYIDRRFFWWLEKIEKAVRTSEDDREACNSPGDVVPLLLSSHRQSL